MLTDVEIAQSASMRDIRDVAAKLGLDESQLELYGKYKAKIDSRTVKYAASGKLVLVTAINPTPAGEGKTTTTVGLGDAFSALGYKTAIALREPSLGPCFGVKGGAAGGGYAQVVPMEDINLHFTGDIHAVTTAHNLLAAIIDNHIHHGNELGLDPRLVTWRRVLDLNERALRSIISGLGGKINGVPRESGFDITVASELMAILCLACNLEDFKQRVERIVVGYTYSGRPVCVDELNVAGAIALLFKDAIKHNVQTLEGTPAFVHGGPFANIAHGCNSLTATKLALGLADVVITEAGFGADLGAEKFLDIKCRFGQIAPQVVVIVATLRALKSHGGVAKADVNAPNMTALKAGISNLTRHIENISKYDLPVVVAINAFPTDTQDELDELRALCSQHGAKVALSEVWAKGGQGGIELAELVVEAWQDEKPIKLLYADELPLRDKISTIAKEIYRADAVNFLPAAETTLTTRTELGYGHLPVCIAKTQYSFSDDEKKYGAPSDFTITVRELRLAAGAGFVVAIAGNIMTMPGLPKRPAAEKMDIDANGIITGLF